MKTKQKILCILLSTTVLFQGARAFPTKKGEYVVVGTPKQISKVLHVNLNKMVPEHLQEVREKEHLEEIVKINDTIEIRTGVIPHIFSRNFDNKEGPVIKAPLIKIKIEKLLYEELARKMIRSKRQFSEYFNNQISPSDLEKFFKEAINVSALEIEGEVIGYACPMGGSHEKNIELAGKRAGGIWTVAYQAFADFFASKFGIKLPDDAFKNVRVISKGSIYEHTLVEQVVEELNKLGYNVNYSELSKGDAKSIKAFDAAMKDLKKKNFREFERLKNHMNPLRFVTLRIKIKIRSSVNAVVIDLKETINAIIPPVPVRVPPKEQQRIEHQFKRLGGKPWKKTIEKRLGRAEPRKYGRGGSKPAGRF